jgi:hypothetical protein
LREDERVQIPIQTPARLQEALDAVERSYGLLRRTGDPEIVRHVALDPEFGIEEAP